jgi:hypothetical protein
MSEQENRECFLCQFKNDDARYLCDLAIGLEEFSHQGEKIYLTAMLTAYHDLDMVKNNLSVDIRRIRNKLAAEVENEN